MKIKEIIIEGLYNTFNHHIPLNQEEGITIIHSPNGFGKTTILRMIDGLFDWNFSIFENIPFESFGIVFSDDSSVEVRRIEKKSENSYSIEIFFKEREEISEKISSDKRPDIPEWFGKIRKKIHVRLIQSQRLLSEISTKQGYREDSPSFTDAVTKHSEDLIRTIRAKLAESASFSQTLDRTFPSRLVSQSNQQSLSIEDLKNKLVHLENKRFVLKSLGLIDKIEDADFQLPKDFDESVIKVLNVYIQDMEQKLGVFDDLADKIELFKRLINKKFLYKRISVSREKGFTFFTDKGESLSATDLSSGEQHELIMLYELLFEVHSNSLILIDEPEISLHIVWQKRFLNDLREIIKLKKLDILISTHSPHIIDDSWDLTVELKGEKR